MKVKQTNTKTFTKYNFKGVETMPIETNFFDPEQVEHQPFNVVKYQALAYMVKPYGPKMVDAVEEDWRTWLQIVSKAEWLKKWKHYRAVHSLSTTPKGEVLDLSPEDSRINSIAILIYSNAIWGFGIEEWLKNTTCARLGYVSAVDASIIKTRKEPSNKNFYDQQVLEKSNLLIPREYGDLDRWLEKLWTEIIF